MLKLEEKPIVWIDIETTGVSLAKDEIVQLAAVRITPEGKQVTKKWLIKPSIEIPEEATEIHGITNEMVKDCAPFKSLASTIRSILKDNIIAGYNIDKFDIPILKRQIHEEGYFIESWELETLDVFKLVKVLFSRKLGDVYKRETGKELEDSHDAYADAIGAKVLLDALINNHKLPSDIPGVKELYKELNDDKNFCDSLGKLYECEKGIIRFNFGKHKDDPVHEHKDYAKWMINNAKDFAKDTITVVKEQIGYK